MNKNKYILLFVCIFAFVVARNFYDAKEDKKTAAHERVSQSEMLINKVDSSFSEINKTLPSFIVDGKVRMDSVHREGFTVYQRYTLYLSDVEISALKDSAKRLIIVNNVEKSLLPEFCSMQMQRELMSLGYEFKFVYSDEHGKSLYEIVADKEHCNKKYWVNL
jgi:hypothetical protein